MEPSTEGSVEINFSDKESIAKPSRSAHLKLGARPVTAGGRGAVQHEEVLVVVVVLEGDRLEVGRVDQKLIRDAQVDLEAVVGHAADVRVAGLVHGRELQQAGEFRG